MNRYKPIASTFLCVSVSLLAAAILITGCNGKSGSDSTKSTKTLKIAGSEACYPLMKILTTAYAKKHRDITFRYQPGSSSTTAFVNTAKGLCDIGATSRDPSEPGEASAKTETIFISKDALVFLTGSKIKINNLTTEQIRQIYSGTITNWRDVGGPDSEIIVLDRAESETVKEIMRQYCLGDTKISSSVTVLYSEDNMMEAIRRTDDCIGYMSYGAFITEKINANIPDLDGISPGVGSISDGTYNITRKLGIVVLKNATKDVRDFADWAAGDEARALMEKKGYGPF